MSRMKKAPTASTARASNLPVNLREKTNMNIVARNELTFHGFTFNTTEHKGQVWFTAAELAKALEYKKTDAVTQIYSRAKDEFTESMTTTLNLRVVRKTGDVDMNVRVFSLRGAHLVAMFAGTPVAKEFRRWVLDILDREVATGNCYQTFDFEMYAHNAGVAKRHMDIIYKEWSEKLSPSLRALGSPLAVSLVDRIKSVGAITYCLSRALEEASMNGKRIH